MNVIDQLEHLKQNVASVSEHASSLEVFRALNESIQEEEMTVHIDHPNVLVHIIKGERERTLVQGDGHDSIHEFGCEHVSEHVGVG